MKTVQIHTCWVGESKDTPQFKRHLKWLEYMDDIKGNLIFEDIWFMDNASDLETLKLLGGDIYDINFNLIHKATNRKYLHIVRFDTHLARVSVWDYPYIFRAYRFTPTLIEYVNPDKILLIDTDFYPVSQKMINIINNLSQGFNTVKDPKYGFNEVAFCFLCKDQFESYKKFCLESNFDALKVKGTVEDFTPFTNVISGVTGGRYGEWNQPQDNTMDYYGQNITCIPMYFNKERT